MRLLIILCSVVVIAFGTEVSAGDSAFLCPPVSFGTTPNDKDRCICNATNWSDEARDVTMELLDTDGNRIGGTPVTDLVQPEASVRVSVRGPFAASGICTCKVTINTKRATASISRRRSGSASPQLLAIANCSLRVKEKKKD